MTLPYHSGVIKLEEALSGGCYEKESEGGPSRGVVRREALVAGQAVIGEGVP